MKQKKVLEQSLCGVLALLGFAACAETSVEYGTPTMDFRVRGKVISDDGKALKDIQVIVKMRMHIIMMKKGSWSG